MKNCPINDLDVALHAAQAERSEKKPRRE